MTNVSFGRKEQIHWRGYYQRDNRRELRIEGPKCSDSQSLHCAISEKEDNEEHPESDHGGWAVGGEQATCKGMRIKLISDYGTSECLKTMG